MSFNLHLWMVQRTVFTNNDFWKWSWAHAAISKTEKMQSCLRAWRPQASKINCHCHCLQTPSQQVHHLLNLPIYSCSFCHSYPDSPNLLMTSSTGDDENFILGNIILKIAHLYLWETLPLKKTRFLYWVMLLTCCQLTFISPSFFDMYYCDQIQNLLIFLFKNLIFS